MLDREKKSRRVDLISSLDSPRTVGLWRKVNKAKVSEKLYMLVLRKSKYTHLFSYYHPSTHSPPQTSSFDIVQSSRSVHSASTINSPNQPS